TSPSDPRAAGFAMSGTPAAGQVGRGRGSATAPDGRRPGGTRACLAAAPGLPLRPGAGTSGLGSYVTVTHPLACAASPAAVPRHGRPHGVAVPLPWRSADERYWSP